MTKWVCLKCRKPCEITVHAGDYPLEYMVKRFSKCCDARVKPASEESP